MPSAIRRATVEDGREFNSLINQLGGPNVFRAQFGQYNFTTLVEYSHVSLFAPSEEGSCGCFASFSDGILSVGDNLSFDEIIHILNDLLPCRTTNSLLLNFWALNPVIVDQSVGDELLRTLFSLCPEVNYIFWICLSSVSPPDFLETNFTKLNLSKRSQIPDNDPFKKSSIYYFHRSKILGQLQVRAARVEDNDDLLPILQTSNPNIANGQEDYFLANLIQSQDDRSKFFVGVHKNRPVGMLATSCDINAELLSRVFALDLYPGLITQPDNDMTIRPHVTLLLGDPNVIRGLELTRLTKHTNTMLINGLKLREASSSNPNQMSAQEYISLLRNTIQKYSSSSTSSLPKGFVITDCPRNEHDARALLAFIRDHRMNIDTVIEVETLEDDDHDLLLQGDHDVVGEYLDAIELLRDPFTSSDPSIPNNEFLQLHIQWKKIEDDGTGGSSRSVSKLTDILIHEVKSIIKMYVEENEEILKANQSGPVTNAFAISLFCLDEKYESRSEDLIRVAFEEYPEKDYCILMIPNSRIPSQALVHFMQCPLPRDGVSFDQSLYLIHRQALLAHDLMTIERIQDINRTSLNDGSLQNVLEPFVDYLDIQDYNEMMNCITRSVRDKDVDLSNNPAEVSFQIIVDEEIIGIICLSRKLTTTEDINFLRENYLLDERISFERHRSRSQAMITYFILNPIFNKWVRYIYREVMRLYHKTVLYYQGVKGIQPSTPIVEEMIPIQIRKKSMVPLIENSAGEGKESDHDGGSGRDKKKAKQQQSDVTTVQCDRPLFVVTKRDISIKKEIIGKRIVIIGGNMTAFKILESLCFVNEKHLNNIYLVMESSPTAWNYSSFPTEGEEKEGTGEDGEFMKMIRDNYSGCLSPKDIDDYTEDEIFALGLPNRVTLIQGKLTDIDRKNRAIIVSDEVIVEYDVLVLATGCQDVTYKQFPRTQSLHPIELRKRGIFCLGNYLADELAFEHLVSQGMNPTNASRSDKILIYGNGIRALSLIGRLEEYGVSLDRVIWVMTTNESIADTNCHEVVSLPFSLPLILPQIDSSIENMIRSYEWATLITIYRNSKITDVDFPATQLNQESKEEQEEIGILNGVQLTILPKNSIMGPKEEYLECSTLLLCMNAQCDVDVFTAVNESGLVYDGGVVVNENFQTVDPCIYAAGPFSRYSRKYKGQTLHNKINNRELGEYVAKDIITRHLTQRDLSEEEDFDRYQGSQFDNERISSMNQVKFHQFAAPKILDYHLPGGVYYFQSATPNSSPNDLFLVTGPSDESMQRICGLKV